MKIFIVPSWYPSRLAPGSGVFFAEWAGMFATAGHEVTIVANILHSLKKLFNYSKLALRRPEASPDGGLHTYRRERINLYPLQPQRSFRAYQRNLLQLFRQALEERGRPDVVRIQSSLWAGAALADELTDRSIPYTVSESLKEFLLPGAWTPFQQRMIGRSYSGAGRIVASSRAVEQAILADFGEAAGKTATIPDAVIEMVPADVSPPPAERFEFVAVAYFRPEKRLDLLLDAFADVAAQTDRARLSLIGDGPLRGRLERQIRRLSLTGKVELTGYLPQPAVMARLARYHCLVLPSEVETFGVALLEAMACGLPVISTRCGGPEDIVTGETGLLVPPGDLAALSAAMGEMLDGYGRYDREAIRQSARHRFSPQRYLSDWEAVFAELVA